MAETETRRTDWNQPDESVYRVEAEVVSQAAANILRELIEDTVECELTAFDEYEVDDA